MSLASWSCTPPRVSGQQLTCNCSTVQRKIIEDRQHFRLKVTSAKVEFDTRTARMQRDFEMSGTASHEFLNPMAKGKAFSLSDDEIKQDYLAQKSLPWRKKVHKFDPEFFKCDNKIVKFNHSQLGDFRALVSFSHTIVSDSNTWKHLNLLTILCFITMAVVYFSQSYRSVNDSSNVSSRIQTLISFVFASYISLVISRWDRIRNTTLGTFHSLFGPYGSRNTCRFAQASSGDRWKTSFLRP